jgi:transcriptional regulator with XRE-family HTH domain/tetratricopeptide (TPR) repeat protein
MTTPNNKLRAARLERRWSVAVASRRAQVSVNTFNRWERGLQVPQLATLDQLCIAFGMSAEELGFGYVVAPSKEEEEELSQVKDGEDLSCAPPCVSLTSIVERPMILNSMVRSPGLPHVKQTGAEQVEAENLSRRQVITALIGAPVAVVGARRGDSLFLLHPEEVLALCASHIPLCWQLYFEGGLAEVEQVLPEYITRLSDFVRFSSPYQKRAASLLSQAYQLVSLLATQHQNYGEACTSAQQGLFYGEMAEDINLQVPALIRRALAYFYLKRTCLRFQTYQQALQLAPQTTPLLLGRVYIGLAEACSKLNQENDARHFLELAQKTFPAKSEEDPCFAYTHFHGRSIPLFEGLMHLNFNQPAQAWEAFERHDLVLPKRAQPSCVELTVNQAFAAYGLGELEQTAKLIEIAVPMAREIGSQLRIDQAYEVYEQMLSRWGDERIVKNLEELFRTDFSGRR